MLNQADLPAQLNPIEQPVSPVGQSLSSVGQSLSWSIPEGRRTDGRPPLSGDSETDAISARGSSGGD